MSHVEVVESIVNEFKQLCKKSLGEDLVALYLLGSYYRGDGAPGLSDLDFYAVLSESRDKSEVEEKLDIMLKELRGVYPKFDFSLRLDAESDAIASGCDGFITSRDSKLLLGADILNNIPTPSSEELKDYGKRMVIRLCDDWMEAEKIRRVPQSLEDAANGAQYMVLKIAQNALFARGLLIFAKKDIVDEFVRGYGDFYLGNFALEAYDVRLKWEVVRHDGERLESFVEKALAFSQAFKDYMAD
jgi:predicted nucleotidyltransferase